MNVTRTLHVLLAAFLLCAPSAAPAQAAPPPAKPNLPAAAAAPAAPAKPLTFDVVSIRPIHIESRDFPPPVFPKGGDSMVLNELSAGLVIRRAYGIDRDNRILGLPAWAKEGDWDNLFNIQAKVAEADIPAWKVMTDAERWQVVQRLLADRFQLRLHHETVQRPIYALVQAKGGAKLKPWSGTATAITGPTITRNAAFVEYHARGVDIYHHAPMAMLAGSLSSTGFGLGREVVDRTGLTGSYDFTLTYAPLRPSATTVDPASPEASYPDLFTAVQEELGLKLEPTTGPIDVLVVDHIARPSEN